MAGALDLEAAERLDLKRFVPAAEGPGAIAAVLSGGKVRSWIASGRGGLECGAPELTPQTVFYVASVAKQFTAACVTCCELDGTMDVDASVRTFLPELPSLFAPITLRHLLHHLGGLPRGRELKAAPQVAGDWWEGRGLWDLIAVLADETALLSPSGSRYAYSNAGYWLLAGAVERASGLSLGAFAKRRLFNPLGMVSSRFRDDPDAPQPGFVVGHAVGPSGFIPMPTRFHGVGDGGLLTTVEDLARWDRFWSGRSPLGAELPARLIERGRRNDGAWLYYARGVSLRSHRGVAIVSHSGSYIGYLSKLVRFPEHDFSVVCLANRDGVDLEQIGVAVADLVLGANAHLEEPPWTEAFNDEALA
jgi:CubicO group peptidase (beta-lactamase class C family)